MRTDGVNVSKCHGLMVRAIFCDQEANWFRRQKTERLSDAGGWDGRAGAGRLRGAFGMRGGGGGRMLIDTILYARCSTDSHTGHDVGGGSWQARLARPRSNQIRPDQTKQTGTPHVCFVRGQDGARDACSPPQASVLQSPRDLLRFVPLFRQDESKGGGSASSLACPPWGGPLRLVWPIARGVDYDS